jgi:hypothetical protein
MKVQFANQRYNQIITDLCGPTRVNLSETLIVLRGGDHLPLAKMDLVRCPIFVK